MAKKRKVKFSDESRRVGRSLIIANKSIKETENLIFFQCKIEFYFIHEHQNLYFHSWLPPLESRRVGRSLIIANKSIKETENLIFFQCKIEFYFIHEHQNLYFHSWLPPLVKILLLVSIRWNTIRSHTEKKKTTTNILYLLLLYFSISNISTINWRTGTLSSVVMWLYRK